MSGMRNASVLPVPVCAVASTSFPSSAGGTADACTGVGVVKWNCASFCWSPAEIGISLNCVKTIFLSGGASREVAYEMRVAKVLLKPLELYSALNETEAGGREPD